MSKEIDKQKYFKLIPKVDVLLEEDKIANLIENFGQNFVVDVIREESDKLRYFINDCKNENKIQERIDSFIYDICNLAKSKTTLSVKKVINGTGTILHTNLGRAPLSQIHLDKANKIMAGYTNLEYNLDKGVRGLRYEHIEGKLKYLTGAESAIVVNNNAAAVMLVLNTLAKGKEAIVSRGELVEIGGSFRIPEVMEASGTKIVDVGTTNKTHLSDYENAISKNTSLLLKVHTSNYKIVGFSETVSLNDMCKLGQNNNIPVFQDLGSGVLVDLSKFGLEKEPTVQDSIKAGVDIISFSGDKLLGGPQAGIIVGKKKYIDIIKKNPITRALRVDKFSIAMLDAVLCEYLNPDTVVEKIPILKNLTRDISKVQSEAKKLLDVLKNSNKKLKFEIIETEAQAGGGSMPLLEIPSYAISISSSTNSVVELEYKLRHSKVPIIARISKDNLLLDLRTIDSKDYNTIKEVIQNI